MTPVPWPNIEFRNLKCDKILRSRKKLILVIPAKAGIQSFQLVADSLDPGDLVPAKAGNRDDDFLRVHQNVKKKQRMVKKY
jgi:hypothetical protein